MTAAQVIHPDDKEALGIERPARADDAVPPADAFRLSLVQAGDVVVARQRMANQDGVGFGRIQGAVGFVYQVESRHDGAAAQFERRVEMGALRLDDTYAASFVVQVFTQKITRSACADRVSFPTVSAPAGWRDNGKATVLFEKSQFGFPLFSLDRELTQRYACSYALLMRFARVV